MAPLSGLLPISRYPRASSSSDLEFQIFVYQSLDDEADEDPNHALTEFATVKSLPCTEYDGLWNSLFYSEPIPEKLLQYFSTALTFARCNVDSHQIDWNKVLVDSNKTGIGRF